MLSSFLLENSPAVFNQVFTVDWHEPLCNQTKKDNKENIVNDNDNYYYIAHCCKVLPAATTTTNKTLIKEVGTEKKKW